MANEIEKNNGEIIIYQSEDGKIRLDVRLEKEKVCRKIRHTTQHKIGISDFSTKLTNYYNLDVISP